MEQRAETVEPVVTAGGDGELIQLTPLETMRVRLSGDDTEGRLEVIHLVVDPGGGPPPHVHRHADETFYVLEGTLVFLLGDEEIEAGEGSVVDPPRGLAHAPRNDTERPAEGLIIGAPASYEAYFTELADALTTWPPTDEVLAAAQPVMERHGVELAGPPPG